ncbi:DUF262 domain-containing protein [Agromyces neolithicus]|uniref:DUF262 domain-containing protein n=2 Tax=Agromyces neolithicus TaxID=269420 RepID=A0ABN2M864_9MICO
MVGLKLRDPPNWGKADTGRRILLEVAMVATGSLQRTNGMDGSTMGAIFRTVAWQVGSLVASVESGSVQLPDLQRPFVWPTAKVRDLFDSMYRGYPVGELMFWDVPAKGEARAIGGAAAVGAAHQIVDGQQRLTSLFAAIKGRPVRDENYRSKEITISFNPFTEKFEVRSPAIAKSASWVEDISTCFTSPLAAHRQFVRRYRTSGLDLADEQDDALADIFVRLHALQTYTFDVVHIQNEVDKRTVADIFVRINSEGVSLKAYDYILTWLSVFWPEGREAIEAFARNSRISPERASEIVGHRVDWTAKNPYINVETGHLVRALVAIGQDRAKLTDAYAALQAKNRVTGVVDSARQESELKLLIDALPTVTNPLHWTEFIRSLQVAGFRSRKGITSTTNIVASYVIFLLGRTRFGVELPQLRVLIARWIFMSQLTSRYTGSGESQLQKDLDRLAELKEAGAAGFKRFVDETIATHLTPDFWTYQMPQWLISSSSALSPQYQCYLAALNVAGADMFMLKMPVSEWMNPGLPAVKGLEGHHLFPRKYQENVLGTTDIKRINQVANFAPTDWDTNIRISDRPPAEYWPELVAERGGDPSWLAQQRYWHALPDQWESLTYDEFLTARRKLIAEVTRDAFEKLGAGTSAAASSLPLSVETAEDEWSLVELVSAGLLQPGHALDPVDPASVIDAVVTEDGTILIDGVHEFDTLDEATHYLGVTNVSGFEYWALEVGEELVPLVELAQSVRRAA